MKYGIVLFDLDGTLLDTSPGIIHCYNETALHYGKEPRDKDSFYGIIGGKIPQNFVKYFGIDEADVKAAVEYYRDEYAINGIKMAENYDGIKELLMQLKKSGVKVAVATLKRKDFADIMMADFGLSEYIDYIGGMDKDDTKTKASIIDECMSALDESDKSRAVLVGDSESDGTGAAQSGIDFIAVTYGWGFRTEAEVKAEHVACFNTPFQLMEYLK